MVICGCVMTMCSDTCIWLWRDDGHVCSYIMHPTMDNAHKNILDAVMCLVDQT